MPKIKNKARSDGRLQSKVYIGGGQYKYVYAANSKELAEKVQEVKQLLGKGIDITAQNDTFGYWSDRWIKLKKIEVSDKRYKTYEARRTYLYALNCVPIAKIKPVNIQELILDAATLPSEATKKPLSYQSLVELKNIARQIFNLAIENRVLEYNPADYVKIPKTAATETRKALTEQQQKWIKYFPHRAQTAAMIMMYAGLRRGELMALMWSDIDLKAKTISVNKSVEMVDGAPVIKNQTKTKNGIRTIYIPDMLVEYLECQPHENLLVCCQKSGKVHTDTSWRRMWESYMASLNVEYGDFEHNVAWMEKHGSRPKTKYLNKKIPMLIPTFTAHQLRHTYITMLYHAGVDVLTAKEQAGHADIKTTLEIYTHLDAEYKKKSISKLNNFLGCSKSGEKNSDDGCQNGCQDFQEMAY